MLRCVPFSFASLLPFCSPCLSFLFPFMLFSLFIYFFTFIHSSTHLLPSSLPSFSLPFYAFLSFFLSSHLFNPLLTYCRPLCLSSLFSFYFLLSSFAQLFSPSLTSSLFPLYCLSLFTFYIGSFFLPSHLYSFLHLHLSAFSSAFPSTFPVHSSVISLFLSLLFTLTSFVGHSSIHSFFLSYLPTFCFFLLCLLPP